MNKQKKILLLGGDHLLLPVIEAAHKLGCYVITVDYLPNNIAHKYSDEYQYASTVDKEAVLEIAKKCQIDAVLTFTDSGVVTAGYVAEQLGLPSPGPYKSIQILQNKGLFRKFLTEHGFNVPKAKSYTDKDVALKEKDEWSYPVMVKPVDAAGSKGITKVTHPDQLQKAIDFAIEYSFSNEFIIEDFIEKKGETTGSDSFSENGKFVFVSFDDQWFDSSCPNPYTPSAHILPSSMPMDAQSELKSELQRLISLLGMQTTLYNIEARVGTDGKPYIMEVSPRAGGNRIAEILSLATGENLIDAAVNAALGNPVEIGECKFEGCWANLIIHSQVEGTYQGIEIEQSIREKNVKDVFMYVKNGDTIHAFRKANDAIGSMFMHFDTREEMDYALTHQNEWMNVKCDNMCNALKISKLEQNSGGG